MNYQLMSALCFGLSASLAVACLDIQNQKKALLKKDRQSIGQVRRFVDTIEIYKTTAQEWAQQFLENDKIRQQIDVIHLMAVKQHGLDFVDPSWSLIPSVINDQDVVFSCPAFNRGGAIFSAATVADLFDGIAALVSRADISADRIVYTVIKNRAHATVFNLCLKTRGVDV